MTVENLSRPIVVDAASPRGRALVPVLIYVGLLVAVVSSLGAPLIPTIATDYGVSLGTAQWSLTITLLVGAVTSPVVGRLGDGPRRRPVLLAALAVLIAGSVIAALPTTQFTLLITGRALQGVGLALLPLAMSVARDHLEPARARSTLATLSVTAVVGVGLGYPITGLIAEHLSFHAGFWMAAVLAALAFLAVAAVVPASSHRPAQHFDAVGATVLGVGLAGLLLAISEAEEWGWHSTRLWGLAAAAAVVLAGFAWQQMHTAAPLIDLRLLRHRAVLTANVTAIVAGTGMYMLMSMVIRYVQTPTSVSYGLGASVVVAGLLLLPLSAFSFSASKLTTFLGRWIRIERILPLGVLILGAALLLMASARGSLWQIVVIMAVGGIGVGSSFAVMPRMIVGAVPAAETSSALALNQVLRTIGYSIGSALTATILTAHTALTANTTMSAEFPTDRGYTVGAAVGIALCLAAAVMSWVLPGTHRRAAVPTPDQQLEITEDVDAAISGTITLEEGLEPAGRAR